MFSITKGLAKSKAVHSCVICAGKKLTLAWTFLRIQFGVNISCNLGADRAVEYIEINVQCKTRFMVPRTYEIPVTKIRTNVEIF